MITPAHDHATTPPSACHLLRHSPPATPLLQRLIAYSLSLTPCPLTAPSPHHLYTFSAFLHLHLPVLIISYRLLLVLFVFPGLLVGVHSFFYMHPFLANSVCFFSLFFYFFPFLFLLQVRLCFFLDCWLAYSALLTLQLLLANSVPLSTFYSAPPL